MHAPGLETTVARLRGGDPAALAEIYERWRPRLYSFLVRLTQDRALAEDVLQETFVRLAQRVRALAPDSRVDAWLFTVARRLVISEARRRHGGWLTALASEEPPAPSQASPFEMAAASETEARLERALAALPLVLREAVLVVGVEGFSPAAAAALCGVSPETLRQRLHRARVQLARTLGREEGP
jgi:RNA polymerase sigma-70 factor (ECF subfamily)